MTLSYKSLALTIGVCALPSAFVASAPPPPDAPSILETMFSHQESARMIADYTRKNGNCIPFQHNQGKGSISTITYQQDCTQEFLLGAEKVSVTVRGPPILNSPEETYDPNREMTEKDALIISYWSDSAANKVTFIDRSINGNLFDKSDGFIDPNSAEFVLRYSMVLKEPKYGDYWKQTNNKYARITYRLLEHILESTPIDLTK